MADVAGNNCNASGDAGQGRPDELRAMKNKRFVFVGGLHRSGTSLLARCISEHPKVSGFLNTGVPQDEGQHLQGVYRPARDHGGPGRFGFDPDAHLTEASPLVSQQNRARLMSDWGRYWDTRKEVLLEKSPPNLIRTRFLQALFPDAYFVMIIRHPIAVAYATQKWSRTDVPSLIEHWAVCHEIFKADRPHIRRLLVVRYEDLVARPQATLDNVFSFLGVDSVACEVEINPDVNAGYLRKWCEDSSGVSPGGASKVGVDLNAYARRVAALGYELNPNA
ncbi:MAG: sulfotransferase [Actinomycetota bacterium]|nr:sulfotransferase [Actinomycetota bacterium]